MPFLRTTVLFKLFYPILILSLLSFSCSTDNSITGGSDQANLSKPSDLTDYFGDDDGNYSSDDFLYDVYIRLIVYAWRVSNNKDLKCFINSEDENKSAGQKLKLSESEDLYDFRDNFLSKSEKGEVYTACYYLLSGYGIDNNLVMKHSMEHLSLMNTGIVVAQELQHGINNKILINKDTYDNLKDIVKIYRDSENHKDIDVVLDYLETDLEKYYNKTKAEIAADFGF